MDTVSREVRSRTMAAIKATDTTPERALRRALRAAGLRGWRSYGKELPGNPDIIYPGQQLAIFVDGCFWHGCPSCCRMPSSNVAYWQRKIRRNKERDQQRSRELRKAGWMVMRFWEHQVRDNIRQCVVRITAELVKRDVLRDTTPNCGPAAGWKRAKSRAIS